MATATKKNGTLINWGTITGSYATQTVIGVAMYDAATVGVMRAYAPIATSRPVLPGDSFDMAIGALSWTALGGAGAVEGDATGLAFLDALFGSTVLGPAIWYPALMTAAPTGPGGGTEFVTAGSSYARPAYTNNSTNFPAATMI